MPLRDHFRSPIVDRYPWRGFNGQWPAMIVVDLNKKLPDRYVAQPQVQLGADQDEYEVRIFETEEWRLVAAIEIVSPSNKDRPDIRQAFAAKCATLLRKGVSVSIVDIVTPRSGNLYADLLDVLDQSDPSMSPTAPPLYAAACRWHEVKQSWRLETWTHTLELGKPLPTLPLWLAPDLAVPLELESSYNETCRVLRIG